LDWYSKQPSEHFDHKEVLFFEKFDVMVEATEFGDVLMTSGTADDVAQGMEYPDENSTALITDCGQSFVYPFYIEFGTDQVRPTYFYQWFPTCINAQQIILRTAVCRGSRRYSEG
jgi:hypothetical protein